jgi:hypothetical protein
VAVLHESTFDGSTIHGALSPVVQGLFLIDPQFLPGPEALTLYRQPEDDPLHRVDELARCPRRGGRPGSS